MRDKYLSKYLDIPNKPLYPFGFGLSYTTFAISPVILSGDVFDRKKDGGITASIVVKNTGAVRGCEVVQLYISDRAASVARPVRELKGFEKIALEAGEEREVRFRITEEMLSFTNIDMKFTAEAGVFDVYIGNSSETENRAEFILK